MKKKSAFYKVYKNIKKNITPSLETHPFRYFLAFVVILSVVYFVFLQWIIPILTGKQQSEATFDGMLSYVSAAITSIVTLFLAFVSLYQSREIRKKQIEEESVRRMNEVFPVINVNVINSNNDIVLIELQLIAGEPATDIYFWEYPVLSTLKSSKTMRIKTTSSDRLAELIEDYRQEDGIIHELLVSFKDIDGRVISQEYTWQEEGEYYVAGDKEYLSDYR